MDVWIAMNCIFKMLLMNEAKTYSPGGTSKLRALSEMGEPTSSPLTMLLTIPFSSSGAKVVARVEVIPWLRVFIEFSWVWWRCRKRPKTDCTRDDHQRINRWDFLQLEGGSCRWKPLGHCFFSEVVAAVVESIKLSSGTCSVHKYLLNFPSANSRTVVPSIGPAWFIPIAC